MSNLHFNPSIEFFPLLKELYFFIYKCYLHLFFKTSLVLVLGFYIFYIVNTFIHIYFIFPFMLLHYLKSLRIQQWHYTFCWHTYGLCCPLTFCWLFPCLLSLITVSISLAGLVLFMKILSSLHGWVNSFIMPLYFSLLGVPRVVFSLRFSRSS